MQQPRGLDNITHESHAADEEIQSNKDSESDSIRKEEQHQVKEQTIHNSANKHSEKKSDNPNKDGNLIIRKKAEDNQAEPSPGNDSILMRGKDDEGSEAEGIPGSKMIDHREFKAQRQKLYESVVRQKRRIEH